MGVTWIYLCIAKQWNRSRMEHTPGSFWATVEINHEILQGKYSAALLANGVSGLNLRSCEKDVIHLVTSGR